MMESQEAGNSGNEVICEEVLTMAEKLDAASRALDSLQELQSRKTSQQRQNLALSAVS
jgi:hypothetical protein